MPRLPIPRPLVVEIVVVVEEDRPKWVAEGAVVVVGGEGPNVRTRRINHL